MGITIPGFLSVGLLFEPFRRDDSRNCEADCFGACPTNKDGFVTDPVDHVMDASVSFTFLGVSLGTTVTVVGVLPLY